MDMDMDVIFHIHGNPAIFSVQANRLAEKSISAMSYL